MKLPNWVKLADNIKFKLEMLDHNGEFYELVLRELDSDFQNTIIESKKHHEVISEFKKMSENLLSTGMYKVLKTDSSLTSYRSITFELINNLFKGDM